MKLLTTVENAFHLHDDGEDTVRYDITLRHSPTDFALTY